MASRLLGRLRNVLTSLVSLFTTRGRPPRRRNHPRISLEKLIKKYKRSSPPHSVYRKILANRLSQQLNHDNKQKQATKAPKPPILTKSTISCKRIKKKPSTQKPSQLRQPKLATPKIERPEIAIAKIKQEPKTEDSNNSHVTTEEPIPCFIPDYLQADRYAPSAPIWTPPPSPRRESLSDNLDPFLPSYPSLPPFSSFPSPPQALFEPLPTHSSRYSQKASSMPPPPPPSHSLSPPTDHPLYPRLTHQRSFSSSPPLRPPRSSSTPYLSTPSSLRKHFAYNYIPQIKTTVPYLRPPPYSPDIPYSHTSIYSRPSPYSPTASFAPSSTPFPPSPSAPFSAPPQH